MRRHRLRSAALVVGVLVLLPAGAAHAALPLDPTGRSAGVAASPASSGSDDAADADDGSDDSASQDSADDAADDGDDATASDDASQDADTDGDDADQSAAAPRSGSRSGSAKAGGSSAARSGSAAKALAAPRGVHARLAAFDRVVVGWKHGSGVKLTRWVVTLRSGSSGRLLYLGRLARSATFVALKPGVRYVATVTATASGGRNASASAVIRTPSLKKAVRSVTREQARVDRAVRLAKVQRFG